MSPTTRIAIVTGGSKGIGQATCIALAAMGVQVAVGYGSDCDGALNTVSEIEGAGGVARAAIVTRLIALPFRESLTVVPADGRRDL